MPSVRPAQNDPGRSPLPKGKAGRVGALMLAVLGLVATGLGVSHFDGASATQSSPVDVVDTTATSGDDAAAALNALQVKGRAPKTDYSRDQFGKAWADTDHNGCDTRNDVLNRDFTNITHKAGTHDCKVTTGDLTDPYTAKEIHFKSGKKTSQAVQIDHVVSLSDAWQTGAQQLSKETRTELANDPLNLLAVDGPTNSKKSDGDAATWLPSNKGFRCDYVARQIAVKSTYHLWVTEAEKSAMSGVLDSCPGERLPNGTDKPKVHGSSAKKTESPAPTQAPAATQATATTPAVAPVQEPAPAEPVQQAPIQEAPVQEAPVQQAPAQNDVVTYGNCAEARAAGAAPLFRGQPGYSTKLDRDGDGVACEAKK